jgi:hypothetical protein
MYVQMIHALARVGALIDDQPIARFSDALTARQFRGHANEPANDDLIGGCNVGGPRDVLVGHDQNMGWRPWGDVPERRDPLLP